MFETFIERANQLAKARDFIQDEAPYASATALLAVHTAISMNDAVLCKLKGSPMKGEDHMNAVRETLRQCKMKGLNVDGVDQLRKLISAKSIISYGTDRVSFEKARVLTIASQRFEAWAYKLMEEIG